MANPIGHGMDTPAGWLGAPVLFPGAATSVDTLKVGSCQSLQTVTQVSAGLRQKTDGRGGGMYQIRVISFSSTGITTGNPIMWGLLNLAMIILFILLREMQIMRASNSVIP